MRVEGFTRRRVRVRGPADGKRRCLGGGGLSSAGDYCYDYDSESCFEYCHDCGDENADVIVILMIAVMIMIIIIVLMIITIAIVDVSLLSFL